MDNFNTINTNKVSKYIIRLKKAIKNNNNRQTILNYYEHLRYHIQLGGTDKSNDLKKKVNDFFDGIISGIDSEKTINSNLDMDLKKCNDEKKQFEQENKKLSDELGELNTKLSEYIKKNEDIEKIKTKHNEDIKSLNSKIDELNGEKSKLENETKVIIENNSNLEKKLDNIKTIISKLFNISGDIEIDLDKEINIIKEKILKYEKVIKNILSKADGKNLNENGELEKYESALIEIKSRSDNAQNLEKELEKIKKQNEDLISQTKSIDEITKNLSKKNEEIIKLESIITDKDNEIKLLTTQVNEQKNKITELENTINNNTKEMNDIALDFENKIILLLNEIYSNNQKIVQEILKGTKK